MRPRFGREVEKIVLYKEVKHKSDEFPTVQCFHKEVVETLSLETGDILTLAANAILSGTYFHVSLISRPSNSVFEFHERVVDC